MIFVASAIQGFVQVRRLLPGTEDDLDVPTTTVEFANRTGFEHFNRNVGDDEVCKRRGKSGTVFGSE